MSERTDIKKPKGGRPRKAALEARKRRIVVWVNPSEQARYLVNAARAGQTGADFARALLCHDPARAGHSNDNGAGSPRNHPPGLVAAASSFELVDALTRIGVDLHYVAPIILETGTIPQEFEALLGRLDELLDHLLPQ